MYFIDIVLPENEKRKSTIHRFGKVWNNVKVLIIECRFQVIISCLCNLWSGEELPLTILLVQGKLKTGLLWKLFPVLSFLFMSKPGLREEKNFPFSTTNFQSQLGMRY
jgi:hypothetical protein